MEARCLRGTYGPLLWPWLLAMGVSGSRIVDMTEDSIEGIYNTLKMCAIISQTASGIASLNDPTTTRGSATPPPGLVEIRGSGRLCTGLPQRQPSLVLWLLPYLLPLSPLIVGCFSHYCPPRCSAVCLTPYSVNAVLARNCHSKNTVPNGDVLPPTRHTW